MTAFQFSYSEPYEREDEPRRNEGMDDIPYDATDAPEIPDTVLSAAARLHVTDVYAVGCGKFQVERYGRAATLRRELESLGFVVTSAIDDRLDDQRYCYASFKERGE